jgi:hypothetical protein
MAGLQGRVFGGYQLADQLGGGGIAEVYRARPQRPGGRDVVVKVIFPEFARQPGFLANFQRITQMSARLATHPHILPLVASGEENGYLYLVTPYVAAGSLKEWLARGSRLGPSDVAPFFRQLCDALGYAHSLGVVHGNVKPSNIFLFEGRHVLLGDFGLLWDVRSMDMTHAGPGTEAVEYMAPELATGQTSQLSDVYSAGIVLFAALVGYPPFRGTTPAEVFAAHAHQPPAHLAQANPSLAPAVLALDGTIQRAIAKRPDERFPSASALAQAIEATIRQATAFQAQSGGIATGWQGSGVVLPQGMVPLGANPLGIPLLGSPQLGSPTLGVGVGSASAAPGMQPLDRPFPPLPPSARIEEDMEQGRIRVNGTQGTGPTVRVGLPGTRGQDVPQQATMRVPAPPRLTAIDGAPGEEPSWQALASIESSDRLAGGGPAAKGGAPQRPGLSQRLSLLPADDNQAGGQSMPAVLPNADVYAPPASLPGFAVAGGAGRWEQESGNGQSPHEQINDVGQGLEQEEGSWGDWAQEPPEADGTGQQPAAFSPTRLGLPRLTSPAMQDMPPAWYELIGEAPRRGGQMSDPSQRNGSRVATGWGDASEGEQGSSQLREPWRSQPGGWDPSETGSWQALGASSTMDETPADSAYSAVGTDAAWQGAGAGPLAGGTTSDFGGARSQRHPYQTGAQGSEDESFWVDDDRVWTKGHRAVRRPLRARPWMRRLVLLLVVCLLVDAAAIVVQRPDLCPTTKCAAISAQAHRLLNQLQLFSTQVPAVVSAHPTTVRLAAKSGKSAGGTVTLQNLTSGEPAWTVTSNLPWVAVSPSGGVLGSKGTATLTITANANGIKAGVYTATIAVIPEGGQGLRIPVTITVS